MPPAAKAAALLMLAAVAAIVYRRSTALDAAAAPEVAIDAPVGYVQEVTQEVTQAIDQYTDLDFWIGQNETETAEKIYEAQTMIDQDQNVRAFLEAIARCEGTNKAADPYRVCYAYKHTINSFADHPAITGEWRGEKLSDKMCAGAGMGPGCVSTAAGKYQITKTTWLGLKRKLKLTDFTPASQDAAAIELLRECGALEYVRSGNVATAVQKARKIWASLPGAGYSQPERSLAWVVSQFQDAGGMLA